MGEGCSGSGVSPAPSNHVFCVCYSLLGLKLCNPVFFELQWTIVTMFSTHVTIYHHLISQAGWNRSNLSIYLALFYTMSNPLSWDRSPGDVLAEDRSQPCKAGQV